MPIEFACKCGKRFRVPNEGAGKKGKCPSCGQIVQVPVPIASSNIAEQTAKSQQAPMSARPTSKPAGAENAVKQAQQIRSEQQKEIAEDNNFQTRRKGMKLIIKRDQDKGFLGGISFILEAKVQLTPEEDGLVKKYKAHKEVLYTRGERRYTISDLLNGARDKCKDITILLNNEDVYKEACKHFKTLLGVMASFGGEEVIEF